MDVHDHYDWSFRQLDADTSRLYESEVLRTTMYHDRGVFENGSDVVLQDIFVQF